jgi:hypothetical protein
MGISFDIIHRTKQQEHNFGYPFQVGHHDMSDDPEDAEIFDMNIHQGDVIVAGSDGSCNSVNRPVKRVVVCATLAVCSSDMWTNVRVRVVVVGCGMLGWNLVGTQYSEGKSFLHFFPSSFVIFFAHPFSLFLLLSVSLFLSGLFDNVSEEEIAGMVGATVSEVKAKVLKSDQEAREKRRKKERRAKEATVTENGGEQAAGALERNRGGMSAMGSMMSSPCAIDGVGEMGGMGSTGGVGGGGRLPRTELVTETFDSLDTDYEDRLQDRSSILGFRGDPASIDGTCNASRMVLGGCSAV